MWKFQKWVNSVKYLQFHWLTSNEFAHFYNFHLFHRIHNWALAAKIRKCVSIYLLCIALNEFHRQPIGYFSSDARIKLIVLIKWQPSARKEIRDGRSELRSGRDQTVKNMTGEKRACYALTLTWTRTCQRSECNRENQRNRANNAERRQIRMYIFAASDSERVREWMSEWVRVREREREREREKEREREGGRERFWGRY